MHGGACVHAACVVRAWCARGARMDIVRTCVNVHAPEHAHACTCFQVSTAIEQVEMIIGRSADAEFLDVVRAVRKRQY